MIAIAPSSASTMQAKPASASPAVTAVPPIVRNVSVMRALYAIRSLSERKENTENRNYCNMPLKTSVHTPFTRPGRLVGPQGGITNKENKCANSS